MSYPAETAYGRGTFDIERLTGRSKAKALVFERHFFQCCETKEINTSIRNGTEQKVWVTFQGGNFGIWVSKE